MNRKNTTARAPRAAINCSRAIAKLGNAINNVSAGDFSRGAAFLKFRAQRRDSARGEIRPRGNCGDAPISPGDVLMRGEVREFSAALFGAAAWRAL